MPAIIERTDLTFGSTKRYAQIASTTFRQWRAASHCNVDHGYALQFEATFEAYTLDERNWVVDFGSLKSFKGWLERMFDHTTLVANDDPQRAWFEEAHKRKIMDVRYVEATGCEMTAYLVFEFLEQWLADNGYSPRVSLVKLQVWEHDGNSAYVRLARQHNGD